MSFSSTPNEFVIIETNEATLTAFHAWLANYPGNRTPTVKIVGGGGSDFIGCQIIKMLTDRKGKFVIEQAFSFGCIYAMAKCADLSSLRLAQTHAASSDMYTSPKEKVYINHLHLVQILYYRDLLREDLVAKYEAFTEKYRHLSNWETEGMALNLFWDDITDWFKI